MYKYFNPKFRQDKLEYTFDNGAMIGFKAIDSIKDLAGFDGTAYSLVVFDEAQNNLEEAVIYLQSRLRGKYAGKKQLVMTANPRPDSWLKSWISYCLDEEGVPKKGTENITRWFVRMNDKMHWGDSKEELLEKFADETEPVEPLSFVFIPATCLDNPPLLKANPQYISKLKSLKYRDYLRLFLGSWENVGENTGYFDREWVTMVDTIPHDIVARCRAYDLASSVGNEDGTINRQKDLSASVCMSKDKFGNIYVEHVEQFQKHSGKVLEHIIQQAFVDGIDDCKVCLPRDSGGAGIAYHAYMVKELASHGVPSIAAKVSGHLSKLNRTLPFCNVAQAGSVFVLRGKWNDEWFSQLESFVAGNRNQKDDMWDATGDAFASISKQLILPSFVLPDLSKASPTAGIF